MSGRVHFSCWVLVGLLVASTAGAQGAGLISGQPIPVGSVDRLGPLAAEKIVNLPVGAAHVFGKTQPDLFVMAGSRFYPDMVLFPWRETTGDSVPVFDPPLPVHTPEYVRPGNPGTVFERDVAIHALWLADGTIVHLTFDRDSLTFVEEKRIDLPQLPRGPSVIGYLPDRDGPGFQIPFGITDGVRSTPPMEGFTSSRDPRYDPYDGAGVWRGGFPYMTLYAAHVPALLEGPVDHARQAAATPREVRTTYEALTHVDLGPGRENDVIGGSVFGPLYYYHASSNHETTFEPYRNLAGPDGVILRHPTIGPRPTAYPNAEGRWSDLIVGGEGALYFYRFLDHFTEAGHPMYTPPVPALQHDAVLYAGTLPVVNVVDWDGDGALDIVAGNSEGLVLFFRNEGTTAAPAFRPGVPLEAGGRPISIQSGYSGSIQGPGEARWGYVCPTVADWNGDGLPDVLMSDATSKHRVFLNEGTRTAPRLGFEHALYLDGLELHGTWRVQPGVAPLAGRMAYVALDDDDEFHLYRQIDVYNLEDGGKLKLESGGVIGANYLKSGGTGRIKITLADWDQDGRTDLLVGTPRHASIPDPEHGLPQSLGKPGSAVLLLRNTGSDVAPVFAFPETLTFHGKAIYFGQHACSPALAAFGDPTQPGLIVGMETGRILYFARAEIAFVSPLS